MAFVYVFIIFKKKYKLKLGNNDCTNKMCSVRGEFLLLLFPCNGLNPNSPLSSSTLTPPTFITPPTGFPFTQAIEEAYSALWNFKVLRFWHFKLAGCPTERHVMAELSCCSTQPWSSHNIYNVFDAIPRLWLWAATEWKSFDSGYARQLLQLKLTTKRRSKSIRHCCSYFSSFFSSQNQSPTRFTHSLIYKSYLLLLLSCKLLHGCEQEVCQNRWNAHGAKCKMLSFMVWRILWDNS